MSSKKTTTSLLEIEAEQARLSVAVIDEVRRALRRGKISQGRLAELLGVAESRVCLVLGGAENMTLATIARLGLALGFRWEIRPLE